MSTGADRHDLDKLKRWHQELCGGGPLAFPVFAVFLVAERDRAAHQLFRQFRASFEHRGGAFQNLVLFGMHAVSSTVQQLAGTFGLTEGDLPALVLFGSPYEAVAYTWQLPAGETPIGEREAGVLAHLEAAIDSGEEDARLDEIPGVTRRVLGGLFPLDVTDLMGRVVHELSQGVAE